MRKVLLALILVVAAMPLSAQWRRGGLFGADVRALVVDPDHPDTYFLGTSGGEVYRSDDGARTWRNAFGGVPFPNYVVDNLVLDRFGRLWAACWGLWEGGVIAVSDDQGKTWTRRDKGLEDFSVRAIAIDPRDADFVVVGGLTGVYRSTDAGETWTKISEQENVESVAIDPRTRDRIYVGTWRQGIRTDDGGATWKPINNGMVLDTDMFSILINPDNPDNLWISTCGWVYSSPNLGDNWTRYRDGFNNRRIHDIEIDPCDPNTLYAGSVAGLYRSEDAGKTWYVVSDEGLVVNQIAMHPQRPNRIVLGIEGDGVYVSDDNARTFTRASEGLYNLRITTITPDPAIKDRVYASVVFGGAASGIYRSDDGGITWAKFSTTRLPEVLSIAIAEDTNSETRFIAGTERGFFWSADGVEWTQAAPVNTPVRVDKVIRFNPSRFFAATSEGVFTTRDAGKSWYRLAGANMRTVDIAVGSLGLNRALFALTDNGLIVFDGDNWMTIADAPDRGHTLAIRKVNGSQFVFVAGAQGVRAGRVDVDRIWHQADAPDAQYSSVFGATRSDDAMLFLTSRRQRDILVASGSNSDWQTIVLPSRNAEVTTVAPDPFLSSRFYVGTLGEGVYVYDGPTQRYVARRGDSAGVGGSW